MKLEALERSADREVNEQLVATRQKVARRMGVFATARRVGSPAHVLAIQEDLLGEACRISDIALHQFTVSAPDYSQDFADALQRTLQASWPKIVAIYDEALSADPFHHRFRDDFARKVRAAGAERHHDFATGLAHDRAAAARHGVTIGNVTGNVAVTQSSPGAQNQAGHHQRQEMGWDPAPLLQGLERLRVEVDMLHTEAAAKDDILDAILSMQREAESGSPEPGRLRRLANAIGRRFVEFGIATGAILLASHVNPYVPPG